MVCQNLDTRRNIKTTFVRIKQEMWFFKNIFLVFGLQLGNNKTLIINNIFALGNNDTKSICVNDFIAVDYTSSSVVVKEKWECYDNLKDADKKIKGLNLNIGCYTSRTNFYLDRLNYSTAKCGEYLLVVGPSQIQYYCMVRGWMNLEFEEKTDDIKNSIIGIDTYLYNRLSSGLQGSINYLSQVTIAPTEIALGRPPSIYVVRMNSSGVVIQIGNSNKIVERIKIKSNVMEREIPMEKDATFILPAIEEMVTLSLISINNDKITTPLVNITNEETIDFDVSFESRKNKSCRFIIDEEVFTEGVPRTKSTLLLWDIWQLQLNGDGKPVDIVNNTIVIIPIVTIVDPTRGLASLAFYYSSEILLGDDFKELYLELKIKDVSRFKLQATRYARNKYSKNYTLAEREVFGDLETKYYYGEDGETVYMRVAINKGSRVYANMVIVNTLIPINTTMTLKKATFTRTSELTNQYNCDYKTVNCYQTECTITNVSIKDGTNIWQDGCYPSCGVCGSGYVCTTSGRCQAEKNYNQRDEVNYFSISGVLLFMLLL
ncbi:hypothetical protein EIN_096910 [Entamoeba invadens IP1]|uniref:Uncharacterized protein n=1 Tax=Entamoeba invadens IP1 TaxID=370355 RepID=A0A0A1U0K9_ENTIV|nr:hypothetical protein EIN_096910 [Entamoeba invadens IP1]ELP87424.1 hypothetical protein EIN_096910 [Entamoeba invadens IP1]|eukprot:XP_004254195.1 hypothetical protein EIN_096910 [Entamoeba invadens IP1]